ncbi:hypothetical protein [Paraglaciecola sp.]|uniref:hypothetical protein n=1 Tax=Paraglaciecola sp. TaxID=1920173 RepID=UPI003EFA1D66
MPELNYSDLYDEIEQFTTLPHQIDDVSVEKFKAVYGSEKASTSKNIIYFLLSEKPIPRVLGESRIIYIGLTKSSFKTRRYKDAKLHATSKANKLKYSAIIENYGAISVKVCDYARYGKTLAEAEGQFLWWYFQNHCEYPPINYTKTKVRNDVVKT